MSLDITAKKRKQKPVELQPKKTNDFAKKKTWLWVVLVMLIVGFLVFSATFLFSEKPLSQKHFLSSVPVAEEVYAAPPINVTLSFDQTVTSKSTLTVVLDGKDVTQGEIRILNNTTIQKDLQSLLVDGEYVVEYNACFESGKCESGELGFMIRSTLQESYADLRGQEDATILISNNNISQSHIIISPGTTVTWKNQDNEQAEITTVNTLHPEYFRSMNSGPLEHNEDFRLIFILTGQYNYEVARGGGAETQRGSIIVSSDLE